MKDVTDAKIAALQAEIAALTLIAATLMQAQPDLDKFHIMLTRRLEQQLGNGAFAKVFSAAQQDHLREFIERLGSLRRTPPAQPGH